MSATLTLEDLMALGIPGQRDPEECAHAFEDTTLIETGDGRTAVYCHECCNRERLEPLCPGCRARLLIARVGPGILALRCRGCLTEMLEVSEVAS